MALRLGLVTSLALGQTFVGGGSGVGPARAQAAEETRPKLTEAQKQEVRDRYDKATRFYYLRKYPEAIVEYEGIYLLSADPVMLYNIAQCHRQADQPEQALQFYKNYLRNAPTATNRADVEKKITEMERQVEDRRKLAQSSGPPAAAASPPPLMVPPPAGAVSPPPAGTGTQSAPSTMPTAPVMTSPAPAGEATAVAPAPPSRVWPMIFMVGGGVFLATSVVLGAAAVSKAHEIESAAQVRGRAFDSDLQKTEQSGQAASGLAVFTGLVGAAALGTGIYLRIRANRAAAAEVARGPVLVPVASAGYAGVLGRVSF
jgi:tetratricopeptide (TPR) repeat protein